ncbi:MAG: hypothetical protein ACE5HA_05620 [Anaerolineae bacterium]
MLVAGAAAFLVALSAIAVNHFNGAMGSELVRSDPIRIIEAVITGVSFLGAGTIIRSSTNQTIVTRRHHHYARNENTQSDGSRDDDISASQFAQKPHRHYPRAL